MSTHPLYLDVFTSVIINPTKFPDRGRLSNRMERAKYVHSSEQHSKGCFYLRRSPPGAIDKGLHSGFPEMCVLEPTSTRNCPTNDPRQWREGYYVGNGNGYGVVKVRTHPAPLSWNR